MGRMHLKPDPNGDVPALCSDAVLERAAELLIGHRTDAMRERRYAPGLAEYLDLVRALAGLAHDEAGQLDLLDEIGQS